MYQYVDNRKYFKTDDENQNIRYVFPLDNDEIDRLQTQHFIQKHVWGGNFSAPIESILSNENSKILDVGCGTGVWTLDMASEFTKPKFFGVDIEPLYPAEIKPENVQFVNANVLTGLPFEDNTFDFVYMRFMLFAFTIADWERAVSELIRVTKVGGFIEIMENDIQWYNENPFCNSVRTTIVEGLKNQRNMELIISPILPKILAKSMVAVGDTNFVNNTSSSAAAAKNLKKAMSEIGFKESEWNATVDTCLKQLEDSKAFDKIHRFWVMKQ
ncbi:9966_t:CDS:2 [Entrophospora sp. SA101]|nr:9966_t:CDS:2 [Entrophospora sp. SA101]